MRFYGRVTMASMSFAPHQQGAQANGDWQEAGQEGPPDLEKKKKKNRKQRYKENLVIPPSNPPELDVWWSHILPEGGKGSYSELSSSS